MLSSILTPSLCSGPDRIIRASRHYERAGQILTRIAVATAKQFIHSSPSSQLVQQSVTVYAPARVDLAGGWTDTPPQAYEWGGVVTTLSLTVNDEVLFPYIFLSHFHFLVYILVSEQGGGAEDPSVS